MSVETKGIVETKDFVLFWGGWPSQWFKSTFVIDAVGYNCCEQFMMAEKARVFGDQASLAKILRTSNPKDQKAFGRQVGGFDAERWNSICRGIVYRGNFAKYSQSAELKDLLLATGEKTIVEASPVDRVWGIGLAPDDLRAAEPSQWRGTNWLGIALMQVRHAIRTGHRPADPVLIEQIDARTRLP